MPTDTLATREPEKLVVVLRRGLAIDELARSRASLMKAMRHLDCAELRAEQATTSAAVSCITDALADLRGES